MATTLAPRVLMSAVSQQALAAPLADLRRIAPFEVITLAAARADPTLQVNAAFISRDITGASTKHQPLAELIDCYAVLRRSPQLRWVHAHSAGADRPIYSELRARGVAVSTSSGANAPVVAQSALAGLLALARRLPALMQAQAACRWAPLQQGTALPDLEGQTAVLVGWGPIAQTLQPWLAMLGLRTIVVRRSAAPAAPGIETLPFTRLAEALPRADWLILACPLTLDTRRLIDAATLAQLRPSAMLINVARGEVVDEAALISALSGGRLAGAFLDVFEVEPLPAVSPLWQLPGVIVTPHCAGHSEGNAARVAAIFIDNLARWLRGEALVYAAA